MSRNDTTQPASDIAFRPAGPGHSSSMTCGACSKPMPNLGRRMRKVRGAKVYVCVPCQVAKVETT
jgi:predicted SprT family Zn-dependent metalloprotease